MQLLNVKVNLINNIIFQKSIFSLEALQALQVQRVILSMEIKKCSREIIGGQLMILTNH
jgi:hypothetical protein